MRIAHGHPARLDVRDLEVVLAIASAGSTVHASASLHLTQSAVSRGLRLAEEKLGLRLVDRTVRGLSPTPAGQRLIEGAGPVLAGLLALEAAAGTPVAAPVRLRIAWASVTPPTTGCRRPWPTCSRPCRRSR
jgi:LysR family transcriptional regulator for metE and metH